MNFQQHTEEQFLKQYLTKLSENNSEENLMPINQNDLDVMAFPKVPLLGVVIAIIFFTKKKTMKC